MKYITISLFFLVSICLIKVSAQQKVKTKFEFDHLANPNNINELQKELYKVYQYDNSGFLIELLTYGKKKMTSDTLTVKRQDGTEAITITSNWNEDMKEIGRIEHFLQKDDQSLLGVGYELWNTNDTFRFENQYALESPGIYAVLSKSEIPDAPTAFYCDESFSVLYNEVTSKKEYNDFGQITSKRYLADDEQGMIQKGMTKYYKYNSNGTLMQDSIVSNGKLLLNNTYFYDMAVRIVRQEQFIIRFGREEHNNTIYQYDGEGNLIKKIQGSDSAVRYTYKN